MKPFVRGSICSALCLAVVGCGGIPQRVYRGPRLHSTGHAVDPGYSPPGEPPFEPAPYQEPMPEVAPPAPPTRPGDLLPGPSSALRLREELPAPPSEDEESVQFIVPVPPSRMPNALDPVESRPILEQSSAEKPTGREPQEFLGEGKIALKMRGHSTYPTSQSRRSSLRLLEIEPEQEQSTTLMQVQFLPRLAPVPSR